MPIINTRKGLLSVWRDQSPLLILGEEVIQETNRADENGKSLGGTQVVNDTWKPGRKEIAIIQDSNHTAQTCNTNAGKTSQRELRLAEGYLNLKVHYCSAIFCLPSIPYSF